MSFIVLTTHHTTASPCFVVLLLRRGNLCLKLSFTIYCGVDKPQLHCGDPLRSYTWKSFTKYRTQVSLNPWLCVYPIWGGMECNALLKESSSPKLCSRVLRTGWNTCALPSGVVYELRCPKQESHSLSFHFPLFPSHPHFFLSPAYLSVPCLVLGVDGPYPELLCNPRDFKS